MKSKLFKLCVIFLALFSIGFIFDFAKGFDVYADEETSESFGTSISLTPVSKILQISAGNTYDETFTVNNDGEAPIRIEAYAAPYSYVYSDEEDLYKLGFTNENNYTQISRWITFKDTSGNYVEKPTFAIEPGESLEITFRITTPSSIPSGGQYAVIFAHTLSSSTSGSGIRTEASPGMVVYGRSTEGESIIEAEFSDLKIDEMDGKIVGSAKVKNSGNVDFNAKGVLNVEPIIGFSSYETPVNSGRISVIPEAELVISDEWEETPGFGIFKVTYSVSVGDKTEVVEKTIVRIPLFVIVICIILLTFLTVWIIIRVRKRKERRSRLTV